MPLTCGYCKEAGHNLRNCICQKALDLVTNFNQAIDTAVYNGTAHHIPLWMHMSNAKNIKFLAVALYNYRGPVGNKAIHTEYILQQMGYYEFLKKEKEKPNPLIIYKYLDLDDEENEENEENETTKEDCPICYDEIDIETIITTNCNHNFCRKCIATHMQKNPACPLCRTNVTALYVNNVIDYTELEFAFV